MTAVRGADEELTKQLAAVIAHRWQVDGLDGEVDAVALVRALVPVVRRYGDQRAADALEAAAMYHPTPLNYPAHLLRHAQALRGQAGE